MYKNIFFERKNIRKYMSIGISIEGTKVKNLLLKYVMNFKSMKGFMRETLFYFMLIFGLRSEFEESLIRLIEVFDRMCVGIDLKMYLDLN